MDGVLSQFFKFKIFMRVSYQTSWKHLDSFNCNFCNGQENIYILSGNIIVQTF